MGHEHHFVFRSGTHTATRVVTLDENEKGRHVEFAFEEARIAPAASGNATFRIAGIAVDGALGLIRGVVMLPVRVLRGPRAL